MSNIQEALRGRITQDRYKDLLSQIGNSNNSNLDLQSLLVQILPALGKVTGPENGNDGKINPIDLISKLDSSILGPLLEMMQCLQPEESSFAPFRSNGNPDNGRDPFNINRERMNNWLNESIAEKPESLHSPNMNVTDQQQPNTSSSSNNEASYRQRNFSGSHINNSSCSSTSSTANRYHQNAFTSSQMSPVNVNCSPKNNTESSFMNDFQQQISPEMESSGGQNHIMGGSLPQISNEARHHQMFEPDRVDEHLIEESARDSEKKLQELLAARSNYTSAADYSHRNNILPSIDRMRSGSPNLDRPIGLSDRNPETDMYHLHHAHQNAQTSPDKQSSEDYSYSDDLQHNGQGTIKLEEQDGFEPEYDAHGLLVTSSGRNRGLGKANEPRFCCQVCGDVAAGFHCGAYVCEACKKFYLRCLKNGGSVAYSCPKTQECVISKETRSHCQYCRYQKCLSLGMYKPGRDDSKHLRVDFKSIPCKVCNAPSSGFHFGAITCEGCKGFFRRMVKEKLHKKFVCTAGGSCDVASSNRTACKACRYQKCLEIGMALEGTRLGRQSNSVKRNTLIQYLNNGMDVALFPKIGESGPEESHQKVDKLLKPATTERIVTPQVLPDLVSVKQETEMDEGYLRYMNTKESSGENSYTMAQQPQQQQENSSHKNNLSGKDYLFVDTSDNMNRSKVLDLDRQSVGPYGRRNSLLGDQGGDVKPFPFGTEKIMALVDNVSANKRTDLLDKIFGGGGDSSNSKRKISESDTSDPGTIKHHKTSEMFTSSNLNPPNSTVSSNPHQAAINQHQRFQRTSSIEGNNEKHGPKLSVASEQSPLSSLNSPNSMGSPSSQSSSYNELRLKDPRWCAVDGSNPNRKKMVKTFLSQVPQTEVDHCFPRKESFDPRSEAADQASGLGSINGTPTVKKRLLSGGEEATGIQNFPEWRDLLLQVIRAYRELEYITKRKREPLQIEKQPVNEKSAAWWAAYESFMHHAKYTLRFVKKIPGFKDLDMEDQITLVRESVYPITLLHHAQFYDPGITDKGWFCNTEEEKRKILHFFPKFKALETHLQYTGKLLKQMDLSLEENAFICALMVFTIDSFLVKDAEAIQRIQNSLCEAFFSYCTEMDTDLNRPGTLILRLAELKRANFEHTQIAIETQRENPDVDFSQLWHEMFLSKLTCQ